MRRTARPVPRCRPLLDAVSRPQLDALVAATLSGNAEQPPGDRAGRRCGAACARPGGCRCRRSTSRDRSRRARSTMARSRCRPGVPLVRNDRRVALSTPSSSTSGQAAARRRAIDAQLGSQLPARRRRVEPCGATTHSCFRVEIARRAGRGVARERGHPYERSNWCRAGPRRRGLRLDVNQAEGARADGAQLINSAPSRVPMSARSARWPGPAARARRRPSLDAGASEPPPGLPSTLARPAARHPPGRGRAAGRQRAHRRARAAMLPTITLTGRTAGKRAELSDLLGSEASRIWSLGFACPLPISTPGGSRRATEQAEAPSARRTPVYQSRSRTAFREVATRWAQRAQRGGQGPERRLDARATLLGSRGAYESATRSTSSCSNARISERRRLALILKRQRGFRTRRPDEGAGRRWVASIRPYPPSRPMRRPHRCRAGCRVRCACGRRAVGRNARATLHIRSPTIASIFAAGNDRSPGERRLGQPWADTWAPARSPATPCARPERPFARAARFDRRLDRLVVGRLRSAGRVPLDRAQETP